MRQNLLTLTAILIFSGIPAYAATGMPALDPGLADANRLAAHGSYPEAETQYKKYLTAHPQNSQAHQWFGRMLAKEKRYEESLEEYRQALKINAKDPSVLNDIGTVLAINGWNELAARFLRQANLVGRFPLALNNLGVVLNSIGAYKQAHDAFEQSLVNQPTNKVIIGWKEKVEAKMATSIDFDFGNRVSWQDIPLKLEKPKVAEKPEEKTETVVGTKPRVPKKPPPPPDEADQDWLDKSSATFTVLKLNGFNSVSVSGTGMVQIGDKGDVADNVGELELQGGEQIELMGDVTADVTGSGKLQLGDATADAQDDDCTMSLNTATMELSCLSGKFKASHWDSVTATKTLNRVTLDADSCKAVFSQDDSVVDAQNCQEVTLLGKTQATINHCKKVIANDQARATVSNCEELTALSSSKVKAKDCAKIERLDRATVDNEK